MANVRIPSHDRRIYPQRGPPTKVQVRDVNKTKVRVSFSAAYINSRGALHGRLEAGSRTEIRDGVASKPGETVEEPV